MHDHGTLRLAPVDHPSVWSADDLKTDCDWLIHFTSDETDELLRAVHHVGQHGLALEELGRTDFPLPTLSEKLQKIRRELLRGRGFVQVRGLPVEDLGVRGTAVAFWGIGRHLSDEFASQNKHGHLLGHVRDLGESRSNASQRGPYSRETIPYHVDACDVVGLCCIGTAKRGGESSIVSSGHVYNTMLARHGEMVESLTRPIYRDRRDEVPPGKEPWYAIPIFNHYDGLLSVSIEPTYIGSVKRHFDGVDPHSDEQLEAIRVVQELADELRFDVEFELGDMQFVHNHVVMHSRQAFEDHEDPLRKRHLLRLWMLNHDGRPLPDAYYERHGSRATIRRPGGIVGPDTKLSAPLD